MGHTCCCQTWKQLGGTAHMLKPHYFVYNMVNDVLLLCDVVVCCCCVLLLRVVVVCCCCVLLLCVVVVCCCCGCDEATLCLGCHI